MNIKKIQKILKLAQMNPQIAATLPESTKEKYTQLKLEKEIIAEKAGISSKLKNITVSVNTQEKLAKNKI